MHVTSQSGWRFFEIRYFSYVQCNLYVIRDNKHERPREISTGTKGQLPHPPTNTPTQHLISSLVTANNPQRHYIIPRDLTANTTNY